MNVYKYWVHFDVGTSSSVIFPKVLSLLADSSDGRTSKKKNGINNNMAENLLTFVASIIVQPPASNAPAWKSRNPRRPRRPR